MKTEIFAVLFASAAVVATLPPAPAQAAQNRVAVKLGDLDLDQPSHARVALIRLRKAAAKVCRDRPAAYPALVARAERFHRCRTATLATALVELDAPAVHQAFDETRRGQPTILAGR